MAIACQSGASDTATVAAIAQHAWQQAAALHAAKHCADWIELDV
jgi:hypothetical protein